MSQESYEALVASLGDAPDREIKVMVIRMYLESSDTTLLKLLQQLVDENALTALERFSILSNLTATPAAPRAAAPADEYDDPYYDYGR
jgi:hypothetical protein